MRRKVLLSIKPKFVEKIFDGTKRYEYRRSLFKSNEVNKIFIYSSIPVQKVVGEFEIEDILSLNTELLWQYTKEYSGIDKHYFDAYFCGKDVGHAIKIMKVKRYKDPQDLSEKFNILYPPQSFTYV